MTLIVVATVSKYPSIKDSVISLLFRQQVVALAYYQ